MSHFTALQQPLKLGGGDIQLKNRVVMASLTRNRGVPDDFANDLQKKYYTERAGAGLVLSEGTLISPQGSEWPNVPSVYSEKHAEAWKVVVDSVHAADGVMFAQLWHIGRVAHPKAPKQHGQPVEAPSPISARGGKFRQLNDASNVAPERELPDPMKVVEDYRQAAKYAKQAGFDGIEFHGANGYLAQQFIDKTSNHRTDKWGGSVENRARFYVEALKALLEVYPANKVGIKLNPCGGYNDVGMNEADTLESYSYIIKHCVSLKLAYIQLVNYLPHMDPEFNGKKRADTHLDVLASFGPLIRGSDTLIFLNGGLTPEKADELVKSGQIDAAVFGQYFINNPDFPKRIFSGSKLNEDTGKPNTPKTFYAYEEGHPEQGYTDYPLLE